jgi:hypothetical protein
METRLKAEALQKYILNINSLSTNGFNPLKNNIF